MGSTTEVPSSAPPGQRSTAAGITSMRLVTISPATGRAW
jgi:hypothetical protein